MPARIGPRHTTGAVSESSSRFSDMTRTPVRLSTGYIPASLPMAFSARPNARGMEGPVMSASRTAVFIPRLRASTASMEVTMDLPTPPLPLATPITRLMRDRACGFSIKSAFSRFAQFSWQLPQSWLHCSLMVLFLPALYCYASSS